MKVKMRAMGYIIGGVTSPPLSKSIFIMRNPLSPSIQTLYFHGPYQKLSIKNYFSRSQYQSPGFFHDTLCNTSTKTISAEVNIKVQVFFTTLCAIHQQLFRCLRLATLSKKRLRHRGRHFPVHFAKFLTTLSYFNFEEHFHRTPLVVASEFSHLLQCFPVLQEARKH